MSTDKITRRMMIASLAGTGLAACTTADQQAILNAVMSQQGGGAAFGLSQADAAAGIKAALNNGVLSAVSTVGRVNGYFADPQIRIPLPGFLGETQQNLSRFGLSGLLDDLQEQLNRGAEAAAPVARDIFVSAVSRLTINDAINIVRGPSNAATQYLSRTTTPALTSLFTPVMTTALNNAGATQTFDRLVGQLRNVPLAPQLGADAKGQLIDHAVAKGLDGIFYYIGEEERAIRSNPAKRTSEILQRVFG